MAEMEFSVDPLVEIQVAILPADNINVLLNV